MDGSGPDNVRVIPQNTPKRSFFRDNNSNPNRPMRFVISHHRRVSKRNSNAAFADEMDTIDEQTSSAPSTTYGYLEHIQSLKSSMTPEGKSLPKKVR
jgi:hypothetical protein